MREGIHPDVKETTITCACGEVYKTKSTAQKKILSRTVKKSFFLLQGLIALLFF
ncbi:MAG: hypothetical protein CI947_1562 [Halanaerobium sp.]|nr:MAG: hypothetical protein CI947_1562 [Halanaerobium sp.]